MSTDVQQLLTNLKRFEAEKIALFNKIQDLEIEKKEYKLVLDVFDTVEPTRRCCRMVGGVLVPRTVAEVKPALEGSNLRIEESLKKLQEELSQVHTQHTNITNQLKPLLSKEKMEKK